MKNSEKKWKFLKKMKNLKIFENTLFQIFSKIFILAPGMSWKSFQREFWNFLLKKFSEKFSFHFWVSRGKKMDRCVKQSKTRIYFCQIRESKYFLQNYRRSKALDAHRLWLSIRMVWKSDAGNCKNCFKLKGFIEGSIVRTLKFRLIYYGFKIKNVLVSSKRWSWEEGINQIDALQAFNLRLHHRSTLELW